MERPDVPIEGSIMPMASVPEDPPPACVPYATRIIVGDVAATYGVS